MRIGKEKGVYSKGKLEKHILGFHDSEKFGGILNEKFNLVITISITKFFFFRILIDEGIFCYIKYVKLFEKIESRKDKLCPYEGCDL